jgi:hypothetical protein
MSTVLKYPAPLLLALAACGEAAVPTDPGRPAAEIVDVGRRVLAADVNAHTYGSFAVTFGGGGPGVITSGPANFPGHPPAGPGTCEDGLWINAKGKRTAGSLDHPHPHCISDNTAMQVVLEPISSCYTGFEAVKTVCRRTNTDPLNVDTFLFLEDENAGGGVVFGHTSFDKLGNPLSQYSGGKYTVVGYAIDASTLGTTNRRVGTLTIPLGQYINARVNYFDTNGADGCVMDASLLYPCLNLVVTASYEPLPAPDGVGVTQPSVPGFLWIAAASEPYNYR